MTLGEQRRKALELLAPPPSRHDHSGVVRPLSYSRPHQAGTTTPMAASRASRGSASSKPSIIGVLAERHARHLAERAQTLQDACKPMHTDPSTIWVICYQRTTQEHVRAVGSHFCERVDHFHPTLENFEDMRNGKFFSQPMSDANAHDVIEPAIPI